MHQPPQGYWRPGSDVAAQADRGRRDATRGRRVREAEVLRLQGVDLRAQPLAAARMQSVHRRLLDGRDRPDGDHVRGRAAPVHGLRRVHDGVPVGRADLRVSRRCRTSARACARCSPPTRRPAGATPACCSTTQSGRAADRAPRPPRQGAAGARHPGRAAAHGVRRHRRLAGRARVRRERRRGAGDRRRSAAVPRRARAADGLRRIIAQALGYQGRPLQSAARADAAALERDVWALAAGAAGARAGDVPLDRRTSAPRSALAIEHLLAHAPTPRTRDRAAAGRAVRHDRRQSRSLHAVPGLRRRVPGRRDHRSPAVGRAAASLHRDQMRAVRAVRGDLSGGRDRAGAAPVARAGGEAAARAERGGDLQLHRAAASRSAPRR